MGAAERKTSGLIAAIVVALLAHVALAALPVERPSVAPTPRTLKVSMRLSEPAPKKKLLPPPPPPPPPEPRRVVTPPPKPRHRALTTRRAQRRAALPASEPQPKPDKKLLPPPPPKKPEPPKQPVVAKKPPPPPPAAKPAQRVNLRGYLTSIYRRVVRHKHYPPAARRLRLEGRVLVRMCLDRAGKLLTAEVKRSSGHTVLDRAALGIVRSAAPFTGVPPAYGKPSVKVVVPVDFRLES